MTDAEKAKKWIEEEGYVRFPNITIMHTISTALLMADKVQGLVSNIEGAIGELDYDYANGILVSVMLKKALKTFNSDENGVVK